MTKTQNSCWCGCGGLTANHFVPGHDSRFHSQAKQVARGTLDEDTLPPLPYQEAVDEFARCVALEIPRWAARQADEAKKKAGIAARKAAKAAAKEAATELAKAAETVEAKTEEVAA